MFFVSHYPAGIYLLKFNNRNARIKCEIRSKLTIKTTFWCYVIYVFNILKKNETWYQTDKGFTILKIIWLVVAALQFCIPYFL